MAGAPKGNKNALKHGLYASKALVLAPHPQRGLRGALEGHQDLRQEMGDGWEQANHFADRMSARPTISSREGVMRAIFYLEAVMDEIFARLKRAEGEEFTRLANALSLAATSLFNGHRTVAFLTGGMTPVEDALRELEVLDFGED
jgi:hypothetical protein